MTTSRYAALALWRLGVTQAAEILRANLEHPAQNVRTEAATAIAEMGGSEGIHVLEARLQNPGAFRMDVLHALGKIDHPRASELLEREMNTGDLRGRLLAARYLTAKGKSAGRKFLLETVRTGELDYVYIAAMHLAALRDREAVPILEQIYENVDREKRLAAAAALAAMGSGEGYRDLVKSLRYDQWSQRAVAAAMLLIIPPPPEM
jgi:HEAT repeat protein